ncbi:MAG: hypothetical protein MZV64_06180 [Ignavibacteriales bacterium]|nr:hypothetical protein [Ignavibacteriales bacterium]
MKILFEVILDKKKHKHGFKLDTELTADHLKELVEEFKAADQRKNRSRLSDQIRWISFGVQLVQCLDPG